MEKGLEPDGYTYSFLISACARSWMVGEGKQIHHGRVLSRGYCSNVFVGTSLVNLYCLVVNVGGLASAYKVVDEMPERNVETWNTFLVSVALRMFDELLARTVVSWTIMAIGCARHGWFSKALSWFQEMTTACVEVDQAAFVAVLLACAELGDLNLAKCIHSYVNKKFLGRNQEIGVRLHNTLIHIYASCGEIEEPYRILKERPSRTTVSWMIMIMGFVKHGFAEKTLDVFEWIENSGEVKPDVITVLPAAMLGTLKRSISFSDK